MFQFVGYNFFSDGDALNTSPLNVDNITSVKLSNAIFDHFNATRDTDVTVTTTVPSQWDYDTIMDADFNGNIDAGNVDFIIDQISAIKIKRRVQGTFEWLTLKTIPINTVEDLVFTFNDLLNKNDTIYEYAFVPVIEDIEGEYIINSILSQFNGVFIGDAETIYKFFYEVQYGNNQRNQQVGIFQVLGKQFPVFVANGELSYESGSVTATIINEDFAINGVNKKATLELKDAIKDFLTNKKAKILKDWAGNEWLCIVNSNISVTYKDGSGMRIPVINFNWTEIGKADNQQDLYNNGVLNEVT